MSNLRVSCRLNDNLIGAPKHHDAAKQPPVTPLQPGGNRPAPLTPQSVPRSVFKARSGKGQVVSVLNEHIPASTRNQARHVTLEPCGSQLPSKHYYMVERVEDKVAAMHARMIEFKKWLRAKLGEAYSEPVPVHLPVQDESLYVGRIVCDAEGQLNDQSVLIEGDLTTSEGNRCPLDLSQVPAFRLFAGQIVAVRGFNPAGDRIVAHHVWTHLPPSKASPATAEDQSTSGSSDDLSMVVAAGPFTINDDLSYEPLTELLEACRTHPPDVLLLLGPFVDVEHPRISDGMLDITFERLFRDQVVGRLMSWQQGLQCPCQVVLIPSVRDVHHHPTFPQPAFDFQAAAAVASSGQLVSLQNPCTLRLDGLALSCVTQDVLRHLSASELQRGPASDRISALASHVLGQRSFYPLYPAHPSTPLDTTSDHALRLSSLPDLMLLPSDLAPFAKVVSPEAPGGPEATAGASGAVVCINPGRLLKGNSGGTYAHITVAQQSDRTQLAASNCRVAIIKI
eukprot:jgi/Chrzof1/1310/Cz10g02170.t1